MNKQIAFDKLIEYKKSEYMFRLNTMKKTLEIKNTVNNELFLIHSSDLMKILIQPFDEYNQFCDDYSVHSRLNTFVQKHIFHHEGARIVFVSSVFTKNALFLFSLYKLILAEYVQCQSTYKSTIDQKLFQFMLSQMVKFILVLGNHSLRIISEECHEVSSSYRDFLLHFSSQIMYVVQKFIPKQMKTVELKCKQFEAKHDGVSSELKTVSNKIHLLESNLKNQMNLIQHLGSKIDNFKRDYIHFDMKTDEDVFVKDIKSLDSDLTSIKYAQKISTRH